VVSTEPALQQTADGEERGGTTEGAPLGPFDRQLFAAKLGVLAQPWKEKERCTVRLETGSTPTATRVSQTPGLRSRMVPLPHAMRSK
jgi:hypothetical protein